MKRFVSHEDTKMWRCAAGLSRRFAAGLPMAARTERHGLRRNIFVSSCETPFLFAHKAPVA